MRGGRELFGMELMIHNVNVIGANVDDETRCAHYRDECDIIAIKFKCCEKWFSCHACHAEFAGHAAAVWSKAEFHLPAILCGGCGRQLTVREYLDCDSVCPHCHRHLIGAAPVIAISILSRRPATPTQLLSATIASLCPRENVGGASVPRSRECQRVKTLIQRSRH